VTQPTDEPDNPALEQSLLDRIEGALDLIAAALASAMEGDPSSRSSEPIRG